MKNNTVEMDADGARAVARRRWPRKPTTSSNLRMLEAERRLAEQSAGSKKRASERKSASEEMARLAEDERGSAANCRGGTSVESEEV